MDEAIEAADERLKGYEDEVETLHRGVEPGCREATQLGHTKARLAQVNGNCDSVLAQIDRISTGAPVEDVAGEESKESAPASADAARAKKRAMLSRVNLLVSRVQETLDFALETSQNAAADKKTQGNTSFKNGENAKAIRLYSEAVALDATNPVYLSNRSACHQKMVSLKIKTLVH